MRKAQFVSLLFLIFSLSVRAEELALPRGIGFRIAGEKDSAKQMREDIMFTRQGVAESGLDAALTSKLDKLLAGAFDEMEGKTPDQSAAIRDRLDGQAGKLLTVPQREEVKRRTGIFFAEVFMLGNGMDPREIDDKVVATFKLTAEQAEKIRAVLRDLSKKIWDEKLPEKDPPTALP